jgi:hypothetical protein
MLAPIARGCATATTKPATTKMATRRIFFIMLKLNVDK